jgi:hypothetical protein
LITDRLKDHNERKLNKIKDNESIQRYRSQIYENLKTAEKQPPEGVDAFYSEHINKYWVDFLKQDFGRMK